MCSNCYTIPDIMSNSKLKAFYPDLNGVNQMVPFTIMGDWGNISDRTIYECETKQIMVKAQFLNGKIYLKQPPSSALITKPIDGTWTEFLVIPEPKELLRTEALSHTADKPNPDYVEMTALGKVTISIAEYTELGIIKIADPEIG
jgi:hypothetical protein